MKFSDPNPVECPECGKPDLEKLISKTGFVLKGGGWYAQGYSDTSKASAVKPSVEAAPDSAPSAAPKSPEGKPSTAESAPAKKAEPKKD